jgi:hypothetical protein
VPLHYVLRAIFLLVLIAAYVKIQLHLKRIMVDSVCPVIYFKHFPDLHFARSLTVIICIRSSAVVYWLSL